MAYQGLVSVSSCCKNAIACSRLSPHMLCVGLRPLQTGGRSGMPKIRQALRSSNCTHRIPAGLPLGIPGIGEEMEGAMQHAPQPGRQLSMNDTVSTSVFACRHCMLKRLFYWAMPGFSATIPRMIWQSFHASIHQKK